MTKALRAGPISRISGRGVRGCHERRRARSDGRDRCRRPHRRATGSLGRSPRGSSPGHPLRRLWVRTRAWSAVRRSWPCPLGTLATPGATFADTSQYTSLAEAQPGGSDPVARLADMDLEGIDQAVLYPSIGLYFWALTDPTTAALVATAYNDWLSGYCAADPARFVRAAMLPFQDPGAAAARAQALRRATRIQSSIRAPNPCLGRSLSDPAYEPVWDVAEELGVPIAVHEGSSVIVPTLGCGPPFQPLILHAVSHSFEEMLACASSWPSARSNVILDCDRVPGIGWWLGAVLARTPRRTVRDLRRFCPQMPMRPSEYFARQCAISFEVDEATLPALLPFIGHDRVVWGSDYPHHDATFPGAVAALRRTMEPLGFDYRRASSAPTLVASTDCPRRLSGPAAVAADYFLAITIRDTDGLRRLFAADAVLDAQGTVHRGGRGDRAVLRRGGFKFADLLPHPGPLRVERRSGCRGHRPAPCRYGHQRRGHIRGGRRTDPLAPHRGVDAHPALSAGLRRPELQAESPQNVDRRPGASPGSRPSTESTRAGQAMNRAL